METAVEKCIFPPIVLLNKLAMRSSNSLVRVASTSGLKEKFFEN